MQTGLQFGLLGLGLGGMYALMALGLVLIHRASRTINFAHGAIGMVGTYLYWELHPKLGFALAYPIAAACTGLLGACIYVLVLRPLRNSTPIARLLATLGVLATLSAAVSLKFPQQELTVTSSLPSRAIRLLGVTLSESLVWFFVIGACLTVGLAILYRRTRFGLATSAVAESQLAAESLGYFTNRIAAANWALASALAATAGILLAPVTGLDVSEFTYLLVPALAAAVVGNLNSFIVTFAAALGLGVLQSEIGHYVSAPGWSDVVPLAAVLVVVIARGRMVPARGEQGGKVPLVGSGKARPPVVAGFVAAAVLWILLASPTWEAGTILTLAAAVIITSLVVVTGFTGQLSLCQFALAGVGAFVAGRLVAAYHVPFELALLAALVSAIPVGLLVALPSVRSRGSNLAVATLMLALAAQSVLFDSASLTGGDIGTQVGSASFFGISMNSITDPRGYAFVTLAFAVLVGLAVANLRRSATGRRLLAVRSNERAAAALGVRVVRMKVLAFMVGSVIAALGGVLFAFANTAIEYTTFQGMQSVNVVGLGVIGGIGYVIGPYWGAVLEPGGLGTNIGNLFGSNVQPYLLLIGGVSLIAVVLQAPDGLAAKTVKDLKRLASAVGKRLPQGFFRVRQPAGLPDYPDAKELQSWLSTYPIRGGELSVSNVTVQYGGQRALDDVSMAVRSGEVLGVIGPNGAGKSTLIEVAMGFVHPQTGTVSLDGTDISQLSVEKRADLGVGMTFQSVELFEDMTVLENLIIGMEGVRGKSSLVRDLVRPGKMRVGDDVLAILSFLGLQRDADVLVRELPYGRRRLVGVGRALLGSPSFLFLDEPVAGLNPKDSDDLAEMIAALADHGVGVVLVEHDVQFVMNVSHRVMVLDFGRTIAVGDPSTVRQDPEVIRAYLGEASGELAQGVLPR